MANGKDKPEDHPEHPPHPEHPEKPDAETEGGGNGPVPCPDCDDD